MTAELERLDQVCVLFSGGQAVGCGAFQIIRDETAELKQLYVRPECRRRGYARQLLEVLELQAMFQGCGRVEFRPVRGTKEVAALGAAMEYRNIPGDTKNGMAKDLL